MVTTPVQMGQQRTAVQKLMQQNTGPRTISAAKNGAMSGHSSGMQSHQRNEARNPDIKVQEFKQPVETKDEASVSNPQLHTVPMERTLEPAAKQAVIAKQEDDALSADEQLEIANDAKDISEGSDDADSMVAVDCCGERIQVPLIN